VRTHSLLPAEYQRAKTLTRSVVGVMNGFGCLGGVHRSGGADDLVALSLRLAETRAARCMAGT
jgi:hypothetical protein